MDQRNGRRDRHKQKKIHPRVVFQLAAYAGDLRAALRVPQVPETPEFDGWRDRTCHNLHCQNFVASRSPTSLFDRLIMARTFRRFKRGPLAVQEATCCIFCGSGNLTHEHIFSRWTHKFLPARSMSKYHVRRRELFIEPENRWIKRLGDIRDWKVRCVCETKCNNGWMRKHIEDVASPIMTLLIKGEQVRLTPEQQRHIAAWAALKAMIAEYDPNSWVTTHHMQRKYLMRSFLPPSRGWAIWIGHYVRKAWVPYWGSMPFLVVSNKQLCRKGSDRTATYYNSISTQIMGQLYIQVIRTPSTEVINNWRFALPDKGSLFRIWPPTDTSIKWPGRTMTDRDADYVMGALHEALLSLVPETFRAQAAQSAPPT